MREDDELATRAYWAMLATLGAALGAALVGWVGGLGPPYDEFAWGTAEFVGIIATFLLLPVALVLTAKARSLGVSYSWRVLGWLLCLVALLLPAIILANSFLNAPGYDVFGCGALLDQGSYVDVAEDRRAICDPVRAQRRGNVGFAAVVGGGVAAALAVTALRPGRPGVRAGTAPRLYR